MSADMRTLERILQDEVTAFGVIGLRDLIRRVAYEHDYSEEIVRRRLLKLLARDILRLDTDRRVKQP